LFACVPASIITGVRVLENRMATTAGVEQTTTQRILTRPVLSWAFYDLANTIFSMNIVSLYMGLWVVNAMGGTDSMYATANSASMLLMFLTAPLLGAISDQAGRRMPFLLASTLACVTLTALLGTGGLIASLVFFGLANYFFQAGLVFYDATLPIVSTPETRGRVGGIGIGMGYVGSFIGVAVGLFLERTYGYVTIFRVTAALFLVFAVPIFLFVREPVLRRAKRAGNLVSGAARQVVQTVKEVSKYRGLGRFLIGRVFYADAANTLIVFMGIYLTNEVRFGPAERNAVLLFSIATSAIGGFTWGSVVDRIGPRRTLRMVLVLWMATLALAMLIPVLDLPRRLFWIVGGIFGLSLGGTWAADRPWMLLLSPPSKVGEFYGLYSMIGRFAAVVGPLLWAFITDTLGWGRPAAVGGLLVMVIISYFILRGVDDTPREWGPDEQAWST